MPNESQGYPKIPNNSLYQVSLLQQLGSNSNPGRTQSNKGGALRPVNGRIIPFRLQGAGPRGYGLRDAQTGHVFGGVFGAKEAAAIAAHFRTWQGPISPQEFGAVAASVVRNLRGVAL